MSLKKKRVGGLRNWKWMKLKIIEKLIKKLIERIKTKFKGKIIEKLFQDFGRSCLEIKEEREKPIDVKLEREN